RPLGLVPESCAGQLGDVHPFEERFSAFDRAPRIDEIGGADAQHLDLAASQYEARLEAFTQLEVIARAPIANDELFVGVGFGGGHGKGAEPITRSPLARCSALPRRVFSPRSVPSPFQFANLTLPARPRSTLPRMPTHAPVGRFL